MIEEMMRIAEERKRSDSADVKNNIERRAEVPESV